MPLDLPQGESVMLEQIGYARPAVEKTPDPGQADQADAQFDAARPVNPGQEGILLPPGAEMIGHPGGVLVVTSQQPGGRQHREMLHARDFPDLLHVAALLFRAVVDPEGVTAGIGPAASHRVAEPVGLDHVRPYDAQNLPLASQ